MTECECTLAGYCNRHQRHKTDRMVELCKTDQRYFDKWETTPAAEQVLGCEYNHWMPLHSYAPKHWHDWDARRAQLWYRQWKRGIKSGGCGCGENWKQEVAQIPVDFTNARAFFEWSWRIHNAVNQRLGKQCQPSLDEAYRLFGVPQ